MSSLLAAELRRLMSRDYVSHTLQERNDRKNMLDRRGHDLHPVQVDLETSNMMCEEIDAPFMLWL
ncbi:hypothetical protein ACP70R_018673 [Stipagrostis hirtigluma subsp. patula]